MPPKTPSSNPSIRPDPHHSGSTVRRAFLIEAIANLFTLPLLTHPRTILPYLLKHPSQINPSTVFFARLFAGLIIAILPTALFAGYSNTRNGIESRRVTYLMLGAGEVLLIPTIIREVTRAGGRDAAIGVNVAVGSVMCLAPPLMWRIYVLLSGRI